MLTRLEESHQKTCWSLLMKTLAKLTSSQLLVGYLLFSGNMLAQAAQPTKISTSTITYYLRNGDRLDLNPSEELRSNNANCALIYRPMLQPMGTPGKTRMHQECQSTYPHMLFDKQLELGTFLGDRFKDGKMQTTLDHSRESEAVIDTEYDFTRDPGAVVVTKNTYKM